MYKHIITLTDKLTAIVSILPSSWAISLYLKIIRALYFYQTKLFDHYVKVFLQTEDYYYTLKLINSNDWCPEDLSLKFIKYAQENYNDLVHA